jgi:hypothetical protein
VRQQPLPLVSLLLALVVMLACQPASPADDEAEVTSEFTSVTTSGSESSDATSTSTPTSTNGDFIVETDMGMTICSPYEQDCPDGEKCVAAGQNTTFTTFKCVPILGDQQPGEPCTWDGIEAATDDCVLGSYCVDSDWNDGSPDGTCRAYCSASDPPCAAEQTCFYLNVEGPAFCVPHCNPLESTCGVNELCTFTSSEFLCVPPLADIPLGEPCQDARQCAPGLLCVFAMALPSCTGDSCCTSFCDLMAADPCPTQPNTTCVAFYDTDPPAGLESVGLCVEVVP